MSGYLPQTTIQYKTYLKSTLVQGLQEVFNGHTDSILRDSHVGIDFPTDQLQYPSVIVRFYERQISNAGVGHVEWLSVAGGPGRRYKHKHYLYEGDLEFAILALSSYDRDLIGDTLVQVLTMGDLETWTSRLLDETTINNRDTNPIAKLHYIKLDTDQLQGMGETQVPTPWQSEDELVYQTAYRMGVHGEFYNIVRPGDPGSGFIENIDVYPYRDPLDPEPVPNPHPEDPAQWSIPNEEYPNDE